MFLVTERLGGKAPGKPHAVAAHTAATAVTPRNGEGCSMPLLCRQEAVLSLTGRTPTGLAGNLTTSASRGRRINDGGPQNTEDKDASNGKTRNWVFNLIFN